MTGRGRKSGFTLVEMLVVISIIVVLVAILFPVFASARYRATQVRCMSRMQNVLAVLNNYRRDYNRYPPKPYYDTSMYMYVGGFSALFPDYVDSWDALVCPADRAVDQNQEQARTRRYSSYNGVAQDPGNDQWNLVTVTYNFNGYDNDGWDDSGAPYPPADPLPAWLASEGMGWKHYPRLNNRNAPDNTIVTHCTNHRSFHNDQNDWKDTIIWLDSETKAISVAQWQYPGASGASRFKTQQR